MKKYYKYLVTIFCVLTLLISGCSDISKTYSDYKGDKETIYAGRIYPAVFNPGYEKVQFVGSMLYSTNAKQLIIEREGDRKVFELDQLTTEEDEGIKTVSVLINDLAEGNYIFTYYTLDAKGNRSVKVEEPVYVFGDRFASTQSPRVIDRIAYNPDNTMTVGFQFVSNYIEVAFIYIDVDGNEQTVVAVPDDGSIVISDFKLGEDMIISQRAKPSATAYDYVEIERTTYTLPKDPYFERTAFADMALPSDATQEFNGVVKNLWDDDVETFAHTATNVNLPSHVSIDMGDSYYISHGSIHVRSSFTWSPFEIQIWGLPELPTGGKMEDYEPSVADNLENSVVWEAESLDLGWINLTDVGDDNYVIRKNKSTSADFVLNDTNKVRYIRLRPTKAWGDESKMNSPVQGDGTYFCVSELYFAGRK